MGLPDVEVIAASQSSVAERAFLIVWVLKFAGLGFGIEPRENVIPTSNADSTYTVHYS